MNICIKELSGKNFLSIGNQGITLIYEKGLVRVKGKNLDTNDSNGCGKSTIACDLLMFALFGETIRKINKEDIPNTANNKRNCEVSIKFSVNNKEYSIERGIKPDKLVFKRIDKEGEENTFYEQCSKALKEKEIRKVLGGDFKTFAKLLVMTRSYSDPFLDMTSADKRKVLEDVLGVSVYGKMREVIKTKILRDLNKKFELKTNELQVNKDNLKILMKNHEDVLKKFNEFEDNKKKKIEELEGKIAENDKKHEELSALIKDTSELSVKKKKLEEHKEKKTTERNHLVSEIRTNKSLIDTDEKKLERLKGKKQCPLCNTETTSDHIVHHLNELEKEITDKKQNIVKYNAQMTEIDGLLVQINTKIRKLEEDITNNNQNKSKLESIKEKTEYLQKQVADITSSTNSFEELLDKTVINKKEAEITSLSEEVATISSELKYYKFIEKSLSDEGIKDYIIKTILPFWNVKVNQYIKDLNSNFTIEFDEKLEAVIKSRGVDPLTYHSFSSGERARIDVAILMSLLDLAKVQNSIDLNIMIIDELLDSSGLSTTGKDYVLRILKKRVELEHKSIYVISHNDSLSANLFDNEINLVLKGGFTFIDKN